jgi:diaminopimelate decarboxylase
MTSPWTYKNNTLNFDNIALDSFAEKVKTPFYLYSTRQLLTNFHGFYGQAQENGLPDPLVCFALKANPNLALLKALAKVGSGADIVSVGELRRALEAGIDPQKIVFSGVGKRPEEIHEALAAGDKGIYSFNVESVEEIDDIINEAKSLNRVAQVAFRLNPKVNARTHKHISTGFKTHKFGILAEDIIEAAKKYKSNPHIKFMGLSVHIGSQLTCMEATTEALEAACELFQKLRELLESPLEFIDVGGGLGVDYSPADKLVLTPPQEYMLLIKKVIDNKLNEAPKRIVFEPGRVIAARAGMLVTKVIRKKSSEGHEFIIVDGGMNDFVRTSLYEAYHELMPAVIRGEQTTSVDVVGPICETADCFATGRQLTPIKKGDLLGVADTGAYGFSMASRYNMRELPPEIVVHEDGSWE